MNPVGLKQPVLQGPLNSSNIRPDSPDEVYYDVSDIIFLPTIPACYLQMFNDGLVLLFIYFDDIRPTWKKSKQKLDLLIPYEAIDLDLPVQSQNIISPFLISDLTNKYVIYIYHTMGVHRLNISWIRTIKNLGKSGKSSSQIVLRSNENQKEFARLVGASYVYDMYLGRHLILLDNSGREVKLDITHLNFFLSITDEAETEDEKLQ